MYKILNYFLLSKYYDNLNKFVTRRIHKFFKIFFVETNFKELPKNNHPLKVVFSNEYEEFKISRDLNIKPYTSCENLTELLYVYSKEKGGLSFYDYGAGKLGLYLYLNKKIQDIKYYYKDQDTFINIVKEIKKEENLENLIIDNGQEKINDLDFVYFGSVIQYLNDYKKEVSNFFNKTKYILFAQTPLISVKDAKNNIIVKQLNLHPIVNYLQIINFFELWEFMKKNDYILVEKTLNRVTKFLHFKNFDKKYKKIHMYDLLFVKNEKK